MTVTTIVPLDVSTTIVPEALLEAGEPFDPTPEPPEPGPGNPEVEPLPAEPRRYGRRVQALLCAPVTHRPLAEIRTAVVDSWSERFGPGSASLTADAHDPAWQAIRTRTTEVRGRTVGTPDLKGLELHIGLEGVRQWSGIIQQPTSWGQGRISVSAESAEAVLAERTLGETEQEDFYQGRGSFPTTSLVGWSSDDNVSLSFTTTNPYEGVRSLVVTAAGVGGWAYGPWVLMPGNEGISRFPVGSALVRSPEGRPTFVGVEVRVDGEVVNEEFSTDELGESDSSDETWQGPVAGRGRLLPEVVDHLVRVKIFVPRDQPVTVDLVRLQQPTLTGYPSPRDLSLYPVRILRDAQFGPGGSSWGIGSTVLEMTGVEEKLTWAHQDDHPVDEAMGSVRDRMDGPDYWITPSWRLLVGKRRGIDRRDVSLTPDKMIDCRMTLDPGGQVDELRGITDIGTASYRHVHAYNGPNTGSRRIRQIVPTPNGLPYDPGRRWLNGQGEWASRTPFSAQVTVDFDYGMRFAVGDGVMFAGEDGGLAWWGPVRVASRTVRPGDNTCVLEVGPDPKVDL